MSTSNPSTPRTLIHDRTHLDWLTVTHDDGFALRSMLRGPTEVLGHGYSTYRRVEQDGYSTKYCSMGPDPRSHMLIMSGKALAAWRAQDDDQGVIFRLAFDGVHCTRLDLARNTAGPWTPYRLRERLEQDRFTSTWRNVTYICSKGGNALTVQLGSRQSAAILRVYDKKAETTAKGEACPFDRLSRWELEIKGDLAPVALRQISTLDSIDNELTGELRWPVERVHAAWLGQRLTLTSQPVDRANRNQARADTDPEWSSFLGIREDLKLVPDMDERGPRALA